VDGDACHFYSFDVGPPRALAFGTAWNFGVVNGRFLHKEHIL
jgi:hypothetical protein